MTTDTVKNGLTRVKLASRRVADHDEPGGPAPGPAARRPGVQVRRVDDPDHESSELPWGPSPSTDPGVHGPDRAGDDPEGPKHEAHGVTSPGSARGRGTGGLQARQTTTVSRRLRPILDRFFIDSPS